ncbi:early nodulin-like protein 3 [Telopea speciosissima]|uniref:early nodulin-like protein 3 n=1 Tax=Telopea speciosissima TaxID=54955 RepID=UPI001CC47785|nr:early nodulin-like protein 3 [Telopea speciosissima]XP_043694019.1 early nodulin-like protein 3 [Telopea speciosissima]XP_043694020.1 early nodulin-like protein 3 [Telopea speciosissima]
MAFSRALFSSLVLVFLLFSFSDARDHLVGGKSDGWKIPNSDSESLNQWAEASRFQIGDSLVWNLDPKKDSVLQVIKEDYVTCNTTSPIAEYKEENTKVKLDRSGPYYFISGAKGHCEKGQKMIVVVMSARRGYMGISPAPSPMQNEGPAIAPTSSASGLKAGMMMMVILGSLFGMVLF